MNIESLTNKILSISKEELIKYLTNEDIRKEYLKKDNFNYYKRLVNELYYDELCYFLDEDMMNKIITDLNRYDNLVTIFLCGNNYINNILSYNNVLKYILNNENGLTKFIENLNFVFGQKIIDYSIKNDINLVNYIGFLKEKEQFKIFNGQYISKLLSLKNLPNDFLVHLNNKVVNELITYKKFYDIFMNYDIDTINYMVECGNFIFPSYLINNKIIISKYKEIEDVNKYRYSINLLNKNNISLVPIIEEERKKYIYDKISMLNDDGVFSYLKENNFSSKRLFSLYNEKILLEMIVDLYFKDLTANFLINLKSIIQYINNVKYNIIPLDRLKFYMKIIDFHELSLEQKKNIFNSYDSTIDYSKLFYEDYNNCKMDSYKNMNDSITKFSNDSKFYNNNLSKKYNIDIYELNNDDFYMYVHTSYLKENYFDMLCKNSDTISLSLIGKKNIGVYGDITKKIIFGYDNLNIKNILHLNNSDSYSRHLVGSNKTQKIYMPDDLLYNTNGYNEILYYQNNHNKLLPTYIVCYNEIRKIDISVAHKLNLPIVKINTLLCRKTGTIDNMLEDNYKTYEEVRKLNSYINF